MNAQVNHKSLPTLDTAAFRGIFSGFPSGVTIVTTEDAQGRPVGLTVSAVMSVSLEPPLLAVCLQNSKYTLTAIVDRATFAVNFLAEDQASLSNKFAMGAQDKFDGITWYRGGHTGSPLLDGARAQVECAVEQVIEAGDHTLILGRILSAGVETVAPLTYCGRKYMTLTEVEAA